MQSLQKNNIVYDLLNEMEKKHWWHQARRSIVKNLINKKKILQTRNPKILSIGCSTGAELEFLKQFGNVLAIDIEDEAINYCQEKGFNVIKQDIIQNTFPDNYFDVIFAMDVLEHIEKDDQAVKQIFRILKPGGHIIVTVHALKQLWSKFDELGNAPHWRRYDKKELQQLLEKHFKIHKLNYYNFFLFPLVYLIRKLSKNPANQLKIPPLLINKFLYQIFQTEKYLLNRINFPIGSSLIAIAKKE